MWLSLAIPHRLDFLRFNPDNLRSEGIANVAVHWMHLSSIGNMSILPPSFKGGPREIWQLYRDAMRSYDTWFIYYHDQTSPTDESPPCFPRVSYIPIVPTPSPAERNLRHRQLLLRASKSSKLKRSWTLDFEMES